MTLPGNAILSEILKNVGGQQQAVPYPMNNVVNGLGRAMPDIVSGAYHVPTWQNKRDELQRGAFMPAPIKPRPPVSGRDILPIAAIAALASIFGADENDLSQGLQGFVGARQGIVGQEFEQAQQADQMRRQGMLNEANQYGQKIDRAEAAKADNDKFLRDLKVLDIKAKNEKDLKTYEQEQLNKRAEMGVDKVWISTIASKNPETRRFEALQRGYSQEYADALAKATPAELAALASGRLSTARAAESEAMLPGKLTAQELKNEYQTLVNKYYPQLSDAKLKLSDEQVKYLQVKRENYPKYLQLALEKLHVSQALAANTIGNTEFDNSIKAWDAQTKGTITALETEMQGHLKRREAVIKQMDEATKAGEDTGDMGEQLSRLNTRIKAIKEQLQSIGDTAPTVGPPTGATEPPPGGFGQISVDQITIPSVTLGGNAPPSKREIGGKTLGAPNTTKKTTTTKKPAKTTPVAKDTKKPVKLKSGWGT